LTFLGEPVITWIKVQKPSFDLEGVLVSSLAATLLVASVALILGCLTGVFTILHHRKVPARSLADDGLHLLDRTPSAQL
jgi:hypothetical protein